MKGVIRIANPFSCSMTLNEWMIKYGYRWVEGREEMCKGLMGVISAMDLIGQLRQQGAVTSD